MIWSAARAPILSNSISQLFPDCGQYGCNLGGHLPEACFGPRSREGSALRYAHSSVDLVSYAPEYLSVGVDQR